MALATTTMCLKKWLIMRQETVALMHAQLSSAGKLGVVLKLVCT